MYTKLTSDHPIWAYAGIKFTRLLRWTSRDIWRSKAILKAAVKSAVINKTGWWICRIIMGESFQRPFTDGVKIINAGSKTLYLAKSDLYRLVQI
jgi:class I fructose-bisphosphate aldolase